MKLWFGGEEGSDDPSLDEVRNLARDMRKLAEENGVPPSEYVPRLHEDAFDRTREAVEAAETSTEQVLINRILLHDRLRESSRELGERAQELPGDESTDRIEEIRENLDREARSVMKRVEKAAETLAPNLSTLATPRIAARLIQLAGGLDDLARKPASTVQVLGAETALFRHLATGSPPPKHGVLYGHPDVQRASDRAGEVARALAAKLAIAARIDAYGGRDRTDELREEWEQRLREVGQ